MGEGNEGCGESLVCFRAQPAIVAAATLTTKKNANQTPPHSSHPRQPQLRRERLAERRVLGDGQVLDAGAQQVADGVPVGRHRDGQARQAQRHLSAVVVGGGAGAGVGVRRGGRRVGAGSGRHPLSDL